MSKSKQTLFAKKLRSLLLEQSSQFSGRDVAVLLSSGTDSMCVLFSLMAVGAKPTAYSFFVEGEEGRFDPAVARKTAAALGIKWTPVPLENNPVAAAREAIFGLGLTSKCDVECGWPVAKAMLSVTEGVVATGHAGDGHFGLTKKIKMHRDCFDAERDKCFSNPNYAQVATLEWFAGCLKKRFFTPWTDPKVVALLRELSWDELNRPRKKEIARLAFEREFAATPPKPRSDLHAGGTGIKEMFLGITDGTDFSNPVAIYRRMVRLDADVLPVLIGQAPSRTSDVEKPLSAWPISSRLCRLCGCNLLAYLSSFQRVNLLREWPGKDSKGDAFDLKLAKKTAEAYFQRFHNRKIILLGGNVSRAFGLPGDFPLLAFRDVRGSRIAVVPHPSGVNLWWNDPANAKAAGKFMRSVLAG